MNRLQYLFPASMLWIVRSFITFNCCNYLQGMIQVKRSASLPGVTGYYIVIAGQLMYLNAA
jgi:hypothetical protein